MKLVHLKIACYLYNQFSNYDESYLKLSKKYPNLDLFNNGQTEALVEWLRNWGCRQFKKSDEDVSVRSIMDWYISIQSKIQNFNGSLIKYNLNDNKELIVETFNNLANRKAAIRKRGRYKSEVRVGPVGTAKILFALRPNLCAPWDTLIYNKLQLEGNGSGYYDYLRKVQEILRSIKNDINNTGLNWNNLFGYLEKRHNSYPKLIDEYYWVTITQRCDPAVIEKLCANTNIVK